MQTQAAKRRVRAGRMISALPVLFLLVDSLGKLLQLDPVVQTCAEMGIRADLVAPLGALEAACAVLFAVPRTAVLGALLLTAFLGGAVATHVLAGTPSWFPIVFGVIVWAGMLLRDDRLRALLPLRHTRAL